MPVSDDTKLIWLSAFYFLLPDDASAIKGPFGFDGIVG